MELEEAPGGAEAATANADSRAGTAPPFNAKREGIANYSYSLPSFVGPLFDAPRTYINPSAFNFS